MANPIANSLLSVLIALFLISSSLAISDVPFIVAHKKASLKRLKSGAERVFVAVDIYNQGSSTAYDVSLTDDSWSKDLFDVVSGNISHSWERLDAGGILSHSFELEAKVQGMFYGAPAVISFRIPTKAALQVAYSTPILPLDVLAEKPAENKIELAKLTVVDNKNSEELYITNTKCISLFDIYIYIFLQRLLARYGSQISVISIVVLFVYLVISPSKSGAGKGSKKRR
ncbi:hypothetical protein JRO89_XS01G0212100 [Xanthoceras sorbifolium]|uniref:Translocon-associated protein subunit beta n=1 Tax=Xanthoceras sorbifolium TaxID=99658 RepID=A0ABQ8IKB9_9ROSI|nr:hypothetical protein JRO89_XS01G0212100 [Xanthoceras sorbifolium]